MFDFERPDDNARVSSEGVMSRRARARATVWARRARSLLGASFGANNADVSHAVAVAQSNIALAKYWGKADVANNMPAVPSLSMTLEGMQTRTSVTFDIHLEHDEVELDGLRAEGRARQRVIRLLDEVRSQAGMSARARVQSHNDFPTAAGLASSASGFAALALAACAAAGLPDDSQRASDLARRASASAARSVYGGYVALDAGAKAARSVASAEHLPLELIVAVTQQGPKDIGSTEGMEHTRRTSPYYASWLAHAPELMARIEAAVRAADFETLGPLVEQSALLMHASMWGAAPAIVYFSPATLGVMQTVKSLRARGVPAYYTMDAGPHVKVLTRPENAAEVEQALRETDNVLRTIHCRLGPDATVTEREPS